MNISLVMYVIIEEMLRGPSGELSLDMFLSQVLRYPSTEILLIVIRCQPLTRGAYDAQVTPSLTAIFNLNPFHLDYGFSVQNVQDVIDKKREHSLHTRLPSIRMVLSSSFTIHVGK